MTAKQRYVYVSATAGSDADGVSGLTAGAPLQTLTRAAAMYGKNVTMNTTFRLAAGEVWRERPTWETDTEYLMIWEPYERSPGDFDLLGKPIVSGGTVMPNWTEVNGNWWSTDVAVDFNAEVSRRILMMDYQPLLRRDRRVIGTSNPEYTGEMTPGTLEEGEWGWEQSSGKVWIGSDPTGKVVEMSVRDKCFLMPDARNVKFDSLQFLCTTGTALSFNSVEGQRRFISVVDMRLVGGFQTMLLGGGDDIAIRGTEASHGLNTVVSFNDGHAGHILIEDCHFWAPSTWGTGPNGYYDDRTRNDCLTFHNEGGGVATVRRLIAHGAYENALDIQAGIGDLGGWKRLNIYDSEFYGSNEYAAVITAPTTMLRCKLHSSTRGFQIKYDKDTGPTLGPQGSIIDQCVVLTGDPSYGTVSNAACLHYWGVTGTEEKPVTIARTYMASHPNSQRTLIQLAQQQWTSPPARPGTGDNLYYSPAGLKFINCQLHNQANQAVATFGSVSLPVATTAMQMMNCTVWHETDANPVLVADTPMTLGAFIRLPGMDTSDIARPTYFNGANPTTVGEMVNEAQPLQIALASQGAAPSLMAAASTAA